MSSFSFADDFEMANPSLMMIEDELQERTKTSAMDFVDPNVQGPILPSPDEMAKYEREMRENAGYTERFGGSMQSFGATAPLLGTANQAMRKKKSKKESAGRRYQTPDIAEQQRDRTVSRASSTSGRSTSSKRRRPDSHKSQKKELTVEERLDIQLQQVMKSKSKLAIAMERVSADMHIKKRDREIVKLQKDLAGHLHTIHTQKDELTRMRAEELDMKSKNDDLQKRNFKLLQKQRTFDEMKRQVASNEPTESKSDIIARVKKEVTAKVERTITELKHSKAELAKEVKAEHAINHKANLVISELEREMKEVKEQCAAAEDQVRYVMAEDEKNVRRLKEVESQMTYMSGEHGNMEDRIQAEVTGRLTAEDAARRSEEMIHELEKKNARLDEQAKELANQVADMESRTTDSEAQLFQQSKKHAIAAETVVSLKKEVAVLETALKQKQDSAAEEAMLAKDAVVGKLQDELKEAYKAKDDIEVALGRLVATNETTEAEWKKQKAEMEETIEKAMVKVEKMPGMQAEISEGKTTILRLENQVAEVTGQLRLLEAKKEEAEAAVEARAVMQAQLDEQVALVKSTQEELAKLAEEKIEMERQSGELRDELMASEASRGAGATEREEMRALMKEKDEALAMARTGLETKVTEHELLASEMIGVKVQCDDLQKKLKVEREASSTERAAAEREREAAAMAKASVARLEADKVELNEEVEALKVTIRALQAGRRASSFTKEDLERCRGIFKFIRNGDYKEVEELLASGMPVDLTDASGFTPLMVACQQGQRRVIKACLRRGASLNVQNQHGDTALHCCMPHSEELARYLIGKGADESITNNNQKRWDAA